MITFHDTFRYLATAANVKCISRMTLKTLFVVVSLALIALLDEGDVILH